MRVLYVSLCVLVLDQASKFAVKGLSVPWLGLDHQGMTYGSSFSVFGDWLKCTFIENPNMAFSLPFGGEAHQKLFLTLFALLASAGLLIFLFRHRKASLAMRLAVALIIAGALGNLIDRTLYGVLYGYAPLFQGNVVDFIHFDLFTLRIGDGGFKFWPIFNVADAAVSIGVVTLLFSAKPVAVTPAADAPPSDPTPEPELRSSDPGAGH